MSVIGLLAATEKTVKLGRIHMRPFQWDLKLHWKHLPLSSPVPWTQKMKQHGDCWLDPHHILQGEFLHPREHNVLIFTDASNAGWGAHSNLESTGGSWSRQEKGLHINLLELKAVILALRHFQEKCHQKQVLVASDNSTVVAYINKQGGTHSAELCTLIYIMWRLLTWCNKQEITIRACHVPGSLNVIADGLSRRNQIQHTEWSLSDLLTNHSTLGVSTGGLVCDQTEQQASAICLSDSERAGLGSGCPQHFLGKPGSICFSSHNPSPKCSSKADVGKLQINTSQKKPCMLTEYALKPPQNKSANHTLDRC